MSDRVLEIIQEENNQSQRTRDTRMDINEAPEPRCHNCRYGERVSADMVDLAIAEESGEGPWREGVLTKRQMLALDSGYMTDCTFLVGSDDDIQTFRCHSLLLCWASPNFTSKLRGLQQQQPIRVRNVRPRIFRKILEYVYSDVIKMEDMATVLGVGYAAHRFSIVALAQYCAECAKQYINIDNFAEALKYGENIKNQELNDFCLQFIRQNASLVLSTENVVRLELSTLATILQQEKLQGVQEIDLFIACHKWSEAHTTSGNCTRESFESILKRYIRFRTFTTQQFASIVCPSKLLTTTEESAIFCCIVNSTEDMPEGFSNVSIPR